MLNAIHYLLNCWSMSGHFTAIWMYGKYGEVWEFTGHTGTVICGLVTKAFWKLFDQRLYCWDFSWALPELWYWFQEYLNWIYRLKWATLVLSSRIPQINFILNQSSHCSPIVPGLVFLEVILMSSKTLMLYLYETSVFQLYDTLLYSSVSGWIVLMIF